MRQVKSLLSQPSAEAADESAALLRDVEVHLGCVAAFLGKTAPNPTPRFAPGSKSCKSEVAVLARFFAGADKMLSGWLHAVRSRRGGYTQSGQAAPLVLVKKAERGGRNRIIRHG